MKIKTKEKLDNLLKIERRRQAWLIGPSLFVLFVFSFWRYSPHLGPKSEILGETTRLVGLPSDEGERIYMQVKLDDGQLVTVYIKNSSLFKARRKVNLLKMEPLIFGSTKYKLVSYVREDG